MVFKRSKKDYPLETFIPMPARVMAIIQLCIVFTLIIWNAGQPFMGDLYLTKEKKILYQYVINVNDGNYFKELSRIDQKQIMTDYLYLQKESDESFFSKTFRSITVLVQEVPPLELSWIFFSFLISIMLLKRVEGATLAVWILPLIALVYAIDNRMYGTNIPEKADTVLYPSEQLLIAKYLNHPLSKSIFEQENELRHAWELYVVDQWTHETPSDQEEVFRKQVENGEFSFTVARLKLLSASKPISSYEMFHKKQSAFLLFLYVGWNLLFAFVAFYTEVNSKNPKVQQFNKSVIAK